MESKKMTAEEFSENYTWTCCPEKSQVLEAMVEFAKLHVTEALKAASKKVKTKQGWWQDNNIPNGTSYTEVDKQSILTSYPLDLIK